MLLLQEFVHQALLCRGVLASNKIIVVVVVVTVNFLHV